MPSESRDHHRRPVARDHQQRQQQQQMSMGHPSPPHAEPLRCPRCNSTNTNPSHFCTSCRSYWTHGGILRDVPVGGDSRKNTKRFRSSSSGPLPTTYAPTIFSDLPLTKPESPPDNLNPNPNPNPDLNKNVTSLREESLTAKSALLLVATRRDSAWSLGPSTMFED